jgi:coenzyme F420-dependent glucose-6-phosphate dehydrogenase
VLTPSFRYHPGVVAQAFATLGCLAPGRIVLGVGSGESMNEVPLGLTWPEPKEHFARLKEAVELIQLLWREERVSYRGRYYATDRATIYDRPDHLVPMYIAASGPAATRLTGRVADGFICTSGKLRELYTETLLPAWVPQM